MNTKNRYVVIRDMAEGNETVGEMWQETSIFSGDSTLDQVMEWAMNNKLDRDKYHSQKKITITKPYEHQNTGD